MARTRAGLAAISAPRNTPVMLALRCMIGQMSGGCSSRPARPTQLTRPR